MSAADVKKALGSLRRAAKLEVKIKELQRQLDGLHADQFCFDPEVFEAAQTIFLAEQVSRPAP